MLSGCQGGPQGVKIPAGFAKFGEKNPVIQYFTDKNYSFLSRQAITKGSLEYSISKYSKNRSKKILVEFLEELKDQLSLIRAEACIPGFLREDLIGVIFLGQKRTKKVLPLMKWVFFRCLLPTWLWLFRTPGLFEDLENQIEFNKRIFFDAVSALATAIETKDKYTGGHTGRVVNYSVEIAEHMCSIETGKWKDFKENLIIGALLHDIGKIGVPERVLE